MYEKTDWKDQSVERERTYDFSQNEDGSYRIYDAFGYVTELGTPVNAENMNHIENGIYNNSLNIDDHETRIEILENMQGMQYDILNNSKALETGFVFDNQTIYDDIKNYRYSTFDLSKFTVVGSPVITDDGIVSGFSKNNYLSINNSIPYVSTCEIQIFFKTSSDITTAQRIMQCVSQTITIRNGKLAGAWADTNGVSVLTFSFTYNLSENTSYILKLEDNGTTQSFKISADNGNTWTLLSSASLANKLLVTTNINFGNSTVTAQLNESFLGSINLKQIMLKTDGKIVFSGNKTGLDVIKEGDYTVTGSPVITDDGIASGFSENNYLTIPVNDVSKPFDIYISFKLNTLGTIQTLFNIAVGSSYGQHFGLVVFVSGLNKLCFNSSADGVLWEGDVIGTTTLNTADGYMVHIKYDGTSITSYLSVNGGEFQREATAQRTIYSNLTYFKIGNNILGNQPLLGSMDLNIFKIYVNGALIYRPCFKIPYTESKTGSKIVDSIYRNRISDMYTQYGCAPYYTLDEENQNFTLPMGEIYGMIEGNKVKLETKINSKLDNSTVHIVETYKNGNSGYILYSNDYCIQWGYLATTANSVTAYTVTFLKEFKDTSYGFNRAPHWAIDHNVGNGIFSIFDNGYNTKAAASVTFKMHENSVQTGTDWIAQGYVN